LPSADVAAAVAVLRRGGLVAFPTETVYGLGADAANPAAVERLFTVKGRPRSHPVIVHLAEAPAVKGWAADVPPDAWRLAEAFWPGPLTLVLPRRAGSGLAPAVSAGLATIGLRVPSHPAMLALLGAVGRPLAAPSANASGAISPTTAEHVLASLGERAPLILDGGATERGVESTIVAVEPEGVRLLRPGPVTLQELEAAVRLAHPRPLASRKGRIEAPGMMASHYAPSKPLRLDATEAEADEWLVGYGPVAGDESLSAGGDLGEAAANLFAALHRAEASGLPRIAVAPVPDEGLGVAINDRLRRAAAPRGA
jgi:L-threonylcarbamoyladenylate synthase